ncbi:MAG: hypothetical protein V3R66_00665 [Rhodospirillales bacterium]
MAVDASKRLPSQENLLLDYVRRLEDHKEGRKAVRLHISKLKSYNRRDHHIRAASNSFESLIKTLKGQLFVLKNSDMFFIYKGEAHTQTETVVQKVRYLFSDDPLLEEGKDSGVFTIWFDVQTDYSEILHIVQGLVDEEKKRATEVSSRMDTRAALKAKQEQGEPLTPEVLERVETALQRTDLSSLVRRQFVCSIDKKMVPEPVFSELFISIKDLRETLLPGVNLLSNRWLFQHLTETLDRRMLAMLSKTDTFTISGDISFNLNISTLLSSEFQLFDDNITAARRGGMIIELQKVDIFADLGAYLFSREFVQEKGYRVCLDGMTYQTLPFIERKRLGVDLIKVFWDGEMVDGGEKMSAQIKEMVENAGDSKIVLCRVDTREAIDFGHSVGFKLFQGRHVESLIAEDTRRRELLRLKMRMERSEAPPED